MMMLLLLLVVVMFVKICVAISELRLHYCELLLQCCYLNEQIADHLLSKAAYG
jgi:hypothetical protein